MILDEKYRIIYDDNNVILQFYEIRKRKKKTGVEEEYEYIDNFYYSNVKQALKNYINKSLKGSKTIVQIIKNIDNLETKIDNIKL